MTSSLTSLAHGAPLYRADEIRRIETLAPLASDAPTLMERAGLAAAELARDLAGASGGRIVIFAGPGNNGGDAFVVARHLKRWWFDVAVVFAGDEQKLPRDAAEAAAKWRAAGGEITKEPPRGRPCDLVIDGLFGIGLKREVADQAAAWVSWMNASPTRVLALDIPSGVDSDSGRVLGHAVHAAHTITFIAAKPGLLTLDGPDHAGVVHVATLGIDAAVVPATGYVIADGVLGVLPRRRANSHKGDYGSVGILGGARGMVGAALLAGRAALKLGAGRVYVGLLGDDAPAADPGQPELMLRAAGEIVALEHLTCLAAGPGLGVSNEAAEVLAAALASPLPLVLDADALNLIGARSELRSALSRRAGPAILTPHPAEAARLLGSSTSDIQRDRVAAALELAKNFNAGVVLKGAGSICAWPDGRWGINTSGNPGMASAGMGDVLTGIIAAMLAQRVRPEDALTSGVYLHGAAADAVVRSGRGPVGLTAGEVTDAARDLVNLAEGR